MSTSTIVLDSSALIAVALFEPGADAVLTQIYNSPGRVIIHMVNVFEVVYKLMLRGIPEPAAWDAATLNGTEVIESTNERITCLAIRLKLNNMHLSMGDCYCLALAESTEAMVITSDRGFNNAKTSAAVSMFRHRAVGND